MPFTHSHSDVAFSEEVTLDDDAKDTITSKKMEDTPISNFPMEDPINKRGKLCTLLRNTLDIIWFIHIFIVAGFDAQKNFWKLVTNLLAYQEQILTLLPEELL